MPPMTKAELEAMINEITARAVGSTLDERLKEFAAKQQAQFATMLTGQDKTPTTPVPQKGLFAARVVMSIGGAKLASHSGNSMSAAAWAEKQWGKEDPVSKALGATTGAQGAFLIQEQQAAEVIEFLRPNSAVRKLNPIVAPMDQGNITLPKLAGGALAGYIGENANLPKSEQTIGQVKANARKLGVLIPISNDLLRRASPGTDTMIRDDMVGAVAQRSDLAFIRGDGTQFTPRGLKNWILAANVIPANVTVNLANVTVDLGKLVVALANNNVRMLRPGWLFAPRIWNYLMTVRDANGNFAFRAEMLTGTLWGWPFQMTTQIPINLGGGSNESEIYFSDFADVVIAEATQLLIDVSTEAAYFDGVNIIAAFSQDQTVIRAIIEHDLVMRHDESAALLSAVLWT